MIPSTAESPAATDVALELHFSAKQISEKWSLDEDSVREIFATNQGY